MEQGGVIMLVKLNAKPKTYGHDLFIVGKYVSEIITDDFTQINACSQIVFITILSTIKSFKKNRITRTQKGQNMIKFKS